MKSINKITLISSLAFGLGYSDSCNVDLDTIINESMCTALLCTTNTLFCTFSSIDWNHKEDDSINLGPELTYKVKNVIIGNFKEKEYIEVDECCPKNFTKDENILLFQWKDGWKPYRFPLQYSSYNSESEILRLKKVCSLYIQKKYDEYLKISSKKEQFLHNLMKLEKCTDSYPKDKVLSKKEALKSQEETLKFLKNLKSP